MMKLGKLAIGLLIMSVAMAGCSAKNSPVPFTGQEIHMSNMAFVPDNVTVAKGTIVRWTNDDGFCHDVHFDALAVNSGGQCNIQAGEHWDHQFLEAGTFHYVCKAHAPGMRGTIVVTE